MPILLRVEELEPGMHLDQNVMNNYSLLLSHDHELTDRDIKSLERVVPHALISIKDPVLDKTVDFEDKKLDREVSHNVRKNISSLISNISQNIRTGVSLNAENIAGMQRTIDDILQYLKDNPVTSAIIEQTQGWDEYLQEHTANVFYLSLLIGNTIRNYIHTERQRMSIASKIHNALDLTPLATAAMFHDIAMASLEHLYNKKEPLTKEELEKIRQHPNDGANYLPDQIGAMVKLVVRSHHENQDGTGYPNQLPGDKINIFARIIRIADAYSAGIADKVYQKAKPQAIVLYEMLHGKYKAHYDPVVLKVFSKIVQPFPVGAKLKLKNNQWGVVVKHNQKDPFKPFIVVAYDEFGDPLPEEKIKELHILGDTPDTQVQAFGNQNLSMLYDMPVISEQDTNKEIVYSDLFDFAYP